QRDRFLSAVVGVAQVEFDGCFEVLPALREPRTRRRLPAADTRKEHVEEIGKAARAGAGPRTAEVAEIELHAFGCAIAALLFGLLRGLLPIRAEQIVLFAL